MLISSVKRQLLKEKFEQVFKRSHIFSVVFLFILTLYALPLPISYALTLPGLNRTSTVNINPAEPSLFGNNFAYSTKSPSLFVNILSDGIRITFTVAGFLMLIWLVWGVFQYIFAGGDKGALAKARSRIQWAIIGFLILIISFSISEFAKTIIPTQRVNIPSLGAPSGSLGTPTRPTATTCVLTDGTVLVVDQSDCGTVRNSSTTQYEFCLGNNNFGTQTTCSGRTPNCKPRAKAGEGYCQ